MLNAHKQVNWQSELFHEFHENVPHPKDPQTPITELRSQLDQNGLPVFGFESKFQHLDSNGLNLAFSDFVQLLIESGFSKFIVLKRGNYLRQAISVARGQQSQTWHVGTKTAVPKSPQIDLDLNNIGLGGSNREILSCFEYLDETYQESMHSLTSADLDWIEIHYENDLELDPHSGYAKAVEFLNLPDQSPKVSLQKIGGQRIEKMLSNVDEVRDSLAGTPYEWMLEK